MCINYLFAFLYIVFCVFSKHVHFGSIVAVLCNTYFSIFVYIAWPLFQHFVGAQALDIDNSGIFEFCTPLAIIFTIFLLMNIGLNVSLRQKM